MASAKILFEILHDPGGGLDAVDQTNSLAHKISDELSSLRVAFQCGTIDLLQSRLDQHAHQG